MKYYKIILILLLFFYLAITYIAISMDKSLLDENSAYYYRISLRYFDELIHPSFKTPLNLVRTDPARHSILMYFSMPFYFIFGNHYHIAYSTNLIFLMILVLSLYGIGKYLKNEKVGLLSAALIMLFPGTSVYVRRYWLDFALTAIIALSIYLLFKSEGFRKHLYSLLFGLSFAIGMLIKIPYIVFVIIPLIYTIYASLTKNNLMLRPIIRRNIFKGVILGIVIPLVYYLPRIDIIINRIIRFAIIYGFQYQQPYGKNLFMYLSIHRLISFVFLIIFIPCIFYYIKTSSKYKTVIISWILSPVIFFSLVPKKNINYLLPVLPAISIIIGTQFLSIARNRIRQIIVIIILLFGLLQYYILTYNTLLFQSKDRPLNNNLFKFVKFGNPIQKEVDTRDWHVHIVDMLKTIKKHSDLINPDKKIVVKILSMHNFAWTLWSSPYALESGFSINSCAYAPLNSLDVDFVLTQENGPLISSLLPRAKEKFSNIINQSEEFFESNIDKFKLIDTFVLPDDVKVYIYKKL